LHAALDFSSLLLNAIHPSKPKYVHGSAFSNQTKQTQILVPILKYTVTIFSIAPKYLSVEFRYTPHKMLV